MVFKILDKYILEFVLYMFALLRPRMFRRVYILQ